MSESPKESLKKQRPPQRVDLGASSGPAPWLEEQALVRSLRVKLVGSQMREAALQAELVEATHICDTPGCLAAVVRRDNGSRVCGAGHPSRWVDRADLVASEARETTLREALISIVDGSMRSRPQAVIDELRDIARAALAADHGQTAERARLLERLAALEHEQWAGWMDWMLHCWDSKHLSGEPYQERWKRLAAMPYAELSEQDKESDRIEARKVLAALATSGKDEEEIADA